jgi:predicted MFS family arabinose efflux permease
MTLHFHRKHVFLWLLANLFFFFQFILRLTPGILREEIIRKFSVDAAAFGTLSGYYYLGYAMAQIPLGIMLDRLSFRFVTSAAIFTAAVGTLIFVVTNNWNLLLFGRLLIGFGSGVAFLAVAKITKTYFDEKYHSFLLGLSFTCGLVGAIVGVTPMKLIFDNYGYDNTFTILAFVAFMLATAMLVMGKVETEKASESSAKTLHSVFKLMINPKILLIGTSGGLMVGALEGFADVWAIPFFSQVYGMSKTESSTVISFVYFGMCFGGPVLALLASFLRSANFMVFLTGVFTILVFMILFYAPALSPTIAAIMMFFLGILCCYQVLVFTIVSNQVKSTLVGLAIAVINCINMSFGHFFHTIIGRALEQGWDGYINQNGVAIYSKENFIYAFIVIPICCFIGQLGFAFLAFKNNK